MGGRQLHSLATFAGAVLAVALAAGVGFGIGILLGGAKDSGDAGPTSSTAKVATVPLSAAQREAKAEAKQRAAANARRAQIVAARKKRARASRARRVVAARRLRSRGTARG